MESALGRTLRSRFHPNSDWVSFGLLAAIIILLLSAVTQVGWIPEDETVAYSALTALFLAAFLASRQISTRWAWTLLVAYGLALNIFWVGRLMPTLPAILRDGQEAAAIFRQNTALFIDRAGGWLLAALGGERTEETLVFALALSLAAWFLATYATWTTLRRRRPIPGIMALTLVLGVNTFYGGAPLWPVAVFISLAILLIAFVHASNLEEGWNSRGIDFPDDVRGDLLMAAGGLALAFTALTLIIPTINFLTISRAISNQPLVQQLDNTWNRIFAGVRQPAPQLASQDFAGLGGTGALPRSFLIGDPPELEKTAVFRAFLENAPIDPVHWRSASFDVYTGSGWGISSEREQTYGPEMPIPHPDGSLRHEITQTVDILLEGSSTGYTLGLPLRFDREVVTYWRGIDDLSRVAGVDGDYRAVSYYLGINPDELRQALVEEAPASLRARYTALPESVPERVHQLARDVASIPERTLTPYDQARAIERFLRQYPYSLDVELPPVDADPVDYFLFDLQRGYCDYYASAMVVMARSVGLPARLSIGYLSQPADEGGVQTVSQKNAHSWAEIYFAGFGWVEFEPTAAFPVFEVAGVAQTDQDLLEGALPDELVLPIPQRQTGFWPLWWVVPLLLLAPLGLLIYWIVARRSRKLDGVLEAYGRLLHYARMLGLPTPPSQTPSEFQAVFSAYLGSRDDRWPINKLAPEKMMAVIGQLTLAFEREQYGGRSLAVDSMEQVRDGLWRRLRLLRIVSWIQQLFGRLA